MKQPLLKRLFLALTLYPWLAIADDAAVAEILDKMRNQAAGAVHYQERRTLELVDAPWHGEGLLLSDAEGNLVKLQQKPDRVVMAITANRLYYNDAGQQQRHAASFEEAGSMAEQILLFRRLLHGQREQLQARYRLDGEKSSKTWRLILTPKSDDDDLAGIELSGDDDGKQRQILIRQRDGETTSYQMIQAAPEQQTAINIQSLLREAIGE